MSKQISVYIEKIDVCDYKCFKGNNEFRFTDETGKLFQWTVILGNNNTGKTNLLKVIASLSPREHLSMYDFYDASYLIYPGAKSKIRLTACIESKRSNRNLAQKEITSIETVGYDLDEQFVKTPNPLNEGFTFYGYGVIRDIQTKGIASEEKPISATENLFTGAKLINFEDWLFQLDYASKNGQPRAKERLDLLMKMVTGEIFPEIKDIRFISDKDLKNYIEFKTDDGWCPLSELGYGYQATLSWLIDFCKKLFDRYPESANPLKEPAVVLIDEIDLHLHPKWQRTIIKYLSDIFTSTQFIVTTHSPFIIQSMERINLYSLSKQGDATIVNHSSEHSFEGWSIEEILEEILDLGADTYTQKYQTLSQNFDNALDSNDYQKAKEAYEALLQILHPESEERKILEIQFSQIIPE